MEESKLQGIVESLIFVSEEPMTVGTLALILEESGISKDEIKKAVEEIKNRYSDDIFGIELREIAGGYQFRTKEGMAEWIQKLNIPKPSRLSQAALETVAIIAYRQPLVRSEIEDIRGVDVGGVLKTLLERELIKVIGRRDEPGNPLIYGTSGKFLELFSLSNLKELPTLRDYEELEKERFGNDGTTKKEDEQVLKFVDEADVQPMAEKWSADDDKIMADIDSNIKSLRKLEKEIFPKPVEQIVAVSADGTTVAGGDFNQGDGQDAEEQGDSEERASAEDSGGGN